MNRTMTSLAAAMLLSACAPVTLYHREGGSVSRMQTNLLSCAVDALAKAPVASEIRRSPPRYIPGRRYCHGKGRCYYSGGYFIDGEIYTLDVNARLRRDVERQCMSRRGYQPVEVPRCAPGTGRPASPGGANRMPALSQTSCALKTDTGRWELIEPAG